MTDLSSLSDHDLRLELERRSKIKQDNYTFVYQVGYHGKHEAQRQYRCVEIPQIYQIVFTPRKRGEWGEAEVFFKVTGCDDEFKVFEDAYNKLSALKTPDVTHIGWKNED